MFHSSLSSLPRYDNVAPMGYFSRLVAQFEQSMLDYRQAIQSSEQHLESLSSGSSLLSAEDIVAAVQRLHQAMTHLAAKYQVLFIKYFYEIKYFQ